MKVLNDRQIEVEGDLELGEAVAFSFDERSLEALMDLLSDQYNDIILAILRELTANARDSHIEAGNPDPIEVILPTNMTQELIIRDKGTGLNPKTALAVFTKYGKSTKRHSDEYVGMLGIGSKAPLAYCDGFEIIARKSGIQTHLFIGKNKDDVGEANNLVVKTDKPDGVEIKIPVRVEDVAKFREKADWLFRFWQFPVLVKVDGQWERWDNRPIMNYEWITDDIAITGTNNYRERSWIVMGDIPYEVPDGWGYATIPQRPEYSTTVREWGHRTKLSYRESWNVNYIVRVPIGSIDFSPSREKVKECDLSHKTMDAFLKYFKEYGDRIIHDKAQELTQDELVDAYSSGALSIVRPLWHGVPVPTARGIRAQYQDIWEARLTRYRWGGWEDTHEFETMDDLVRTRFRDNEKSRISIHELSTAKIGSEHDTHRILVSGYKPRNITENYTYRILRAAEKKGLKIKGVDRVEIWVNGPKRSQFYSFDYVLNWEWVKEVSDPMRRMKRKKDSREKIADMTFSHLLAEGNRFRKKSLPIDKIDRYSPIVMYHPSDDYDYQVEEWLRENIPGTQVFKVYKKRLPHFSKVFPTAVHYKAVMEYFLNEMMDDIGFTELFYIMYSSKLPYRAYRFMQYDFSGLHDDDLRECLEDYQSAQQKVGDFNNVVRKGDFYRETAMKALKDQNPDAFKRANDLIDRIEKDYPLFDVATRTQKEFVEYVNAMHAFRNS